MSLATTLVSLQARLSHAILNIDFAPGAGLNDVTLGAIDVASVGYYNDTHQLFDYNSTFPWGLNMGADTNYAGM